MATSAIDNIRPLLNGVSGELLNFMAFCPVHPDGQKHGRPSLHVYEDNGRVFIKCFAGCAKEAILDALGLSWSDMFDESLHRPAKPKKEEFRVRDVSGNLIATHHRLNLPDGSKRVWWMGPNGERKLRDMGLSPKDMPPYPSERVKEYPNNAVVFVTEGEKAALALLEHGIPAVGTVCGASAVPTREALAALEDRDVILWPDNDEEGRAHMRQVGRQLFGFAKRVRIFSWEDAPPKGDAADHPDIKGAMWDIVEAAETYVPTPEKDDAAISFATFAESVYERVEKRRRFQGITGIKTHVDAIDNLTFGWENDLLYLVLAGTNTGKSLFAGQVALQAALDGHRTLLFTGEQAPWLYLDRFAHYIARVSYDKSLRGQITEEQAKAVRKAAYEMANYPLAVNPQTGKDTEYIRRMIEQYEPELLVVDHIQRVRASDGSVKRHQQVGDISAELAMMKTEYDISIVVAAQANRAHGGNRKPEIFETRDSGEIENDADVGLVLYRPGRTNENYPKDLIEVHCDKSRIGPLGNGKARFVKEQNWIEDIPPSELQYYEQAVSNVPRVKPTTDYDVQGSLLR